MPYSDNLYSIDSDDEYPDVAPPAGHGTYSALPRQQDPPLASWGSGLQDEDDGPYDALSPADGNFPAAHTDSGAIRTPGSSSYYVPHTPHVPNVMVADPSLDQGSTAESKAREARQEREAAAAPTNSESDSPSPRATSPHYSYTHQPTSSTSSRATHYQPSTAGAYSSYAPSTTSHNTSHGPRRSIYTPTSSLLHREAPPAYTPSPTNTYAGSTSPTSPTVSSQAQSESSSNYYQTFQPSMGRPEETRGLLAHPESMGGPPDDDFGNVSPTWRDRVTRTASCFNWRNCRYAAVCLVLLLLAGGFIIDGITSVEKDLKPKDPSNSKPSKPPSKSPSKSPSEPPSKSPVLDPPHFDYPIYDGDLPWPVSDRCSGKPVERTSFAVLVNYGPDHSLSIVQDVTEPDRHYGTADVHVSGDVILRRTGQGSGSPEPGMSVELLQNDQAIEVTTAWDKDTQSLHVGVPRNSQGMDSATRPCVAVRITVWVPGDAMLDTLSIDNVHLGIRLMDNLALRVAQNSHLSSVAGPIVAGTDGTGKADKLVDDSPPEYYQFDSRVIEVSTTSDDITGFWPLYDYLGLSSISGDIKARVALREESKDAPKPANLNVESTSGDVEIWEPVDKALSSSSASHSPARYIPARDYRTNIQSRSGKISGAVAFSSKCRIHTISGDSQVELLPVLRASDADSGASSGLETATTSGTTEIRVRDPLWIDDEGKGYLPAGSSPPPLRCLRSRHSSTSADLQLAYPASWEGQLDLEALSGDLKVRGEGVRVIRDGKSWPVNRHLVARKGSDGGSSVVVKTTSGDVKVVVGE